MSENVNNRTIQIQAIPARVLKGDTGDTGPKGDDGADGKTAYAYAQEGGYTGTEIEFAAKLAQDMPTALPNPQPITVNGQRYDGSEAVTVTVNSMPDGASANQQLATDKDGIVKWEEKNRFTAQRFFTLHPPLIFRLFYIK